MYNWGGYMKRLDIISNFRCLNKYFNGWKLGHYVTVSKDCKLIAKSLEDNPEAVQDWFAPSNRRMYRKLLGYYEKAKTNPFRYDSGLVSLDLRNQKSNNGELKEIPFIFTPYLMMNFITDWHTKTKKTHFLSKRERVNKSLIPQRAIGVGMVLSIIALRGSARNNDSKPYIILIKRNNKKPDGKSGIRDGELDTAVVEGINCGDFEIGGNYDYPYEANLESIAVRALREERGINYALLDAYHLIQMPKRYYLGFDYEWQQWNFFGTVKIDCTVEELVRQSHYFSKDVFETNDILAMPFNKNTVCYQISQRNITVGRHGIDTQKFSDIENKGMWNTGFFSVAFAFLEEGENIFNNLHNSLSSKATVGKPRACVRKGMNWLSQTISSINIGWNGVLLAIALIITVIVIFCPFIPDIVALFSLLSALALFRTQYVASNNILHIPMKEAANTCDLEQFIGLTILDGEIYDSSKKEHTHEREIYLQVDTKRGLGDKVTCQVSRSCNVFPEDSEDKQNWCRLSCGEEVVEIPHWIFRPDNGNKCPVRVVLSLVSENKMILFEKDGKQGLKNYVDSKIDLMDIGCITKRYVPLNLLSKHGEIIKKINIEEFQPKIINYKYLLQREKGNGDIEYIIIGHIYLQKEIDCIPPTLSSFGEYLLTPLSRDILKSDYSLKFDSVNNCANDLVITEYLGYKLPEYGR